MKIFAQFYVNGANGKPTQKLGTDGVLPLDGRWSKDTCIYKAKTHGNKLNKNLNAGITGFYLMRGERFSEATLHSITFFKVS